MKSFLAPGWLMKPPSDAKDKVHKWIQRLHRHFLEIPATEQVTQKHPRVKPSAGLLGAFQYLKYLVFREDARHGNVVGVHSSTAR